MVRVERISELIKREICNMIQLGDINDPRVRLATITSVEVSKDLQHARVKFSVLSDDPAVIKNTTDGFNSCRGLIRRLIGQRLVTRHTPEFHFIFDKTVQHAARIDAVLEEIKKTTG